MPDPLLRMEARLYMDVFNDFNDFKILPWSKVGEDRGVYYPMRKTALRMMKQERRIQEYEQYKKEHSTTNNDQDDNDNNTSTPLQQLATNNNNEEKRQHQRKFAIRQTDRKAFGHTRSNKGTSYKEEVKNTAVFPVPDYDDVKNWNEKSWLKYAAPLELEAWFKEHPEDKPDGWVSPLKKKKDEKKTD